MNMIIFNDNYPKLHNQTSAKLIAAEYITINKERHQELLEYDTIKSDGTYYPIENGEYVQLILLGDKRIPFCTLRRLDNNYKLHYYKSLIGAQIKIVVKKDPKI